MFKLYACPSDRRRMLFTLQRSKVRLLRVFVRVVCACGTDMLRCGWSRLGLLCVRAFASWIPSRNMCTDASYTGNLLSSSVFLRRTMRRTMCTSRTSFVSRARSRAFCTLLYSEYHHEFPIRSIRFHYARLFAEEDLTDI